MKRFLLLVWLVFPILFGFSQDVSSENPGSRIGGDIPYSIPQTIFVGDKGRLVFPLGSAFAGIEGRVLQGADLGRTEDLTITRVELERRGTSARLLIDFQAYAPGVLELPPLEIASYTFSGLKVTISSILSLDQQGMVLSGPAEPLPAPGTAVMIYGTILGIILLLLGATLGTFWGKTRMGAFLEQLKRRRIIRAMGKNLRRLRSDLDRDGDSTQAGREAETLGVLSSEFRIYLGMFTGTNCRAMVPREFLGLPILPPGAAFSGAALSELFRRCDTLRFSGAGIGRDAVFALMDDFAEFITALEAAEKDRVAAEKARRAAEKKHPQPGSSGKAAVTPAPFPSGGAR
jgi:hypothetical protein